MYPPVVIFPLPGFAVPWLAMIFTWPYRPPGAVPPFAVSEILPPPAPPNPELAVTSTVPYRPLLVFIFTEAGDKDAPLSAVMLMVEKTILEI